MKNTLNRQFVICILGIIVHILTLLWYISGKLYPGIYPIGIESGIVMLAEFMIFLFSFKNYRDGVHAMAVFLSVISLLGALFSGFCFAVWCLFVL